MRKHIQQKKYRGGYLLVEMLVSMLIFTIVIVSSSVALLTIVDANTKSQTIKSVMDNVNVAVENMSRTIRIGTDYHCVTSFNDSLVGDPNCIDDGKSGISFRPQDADINDPNDRITYYLCTDTLVTNGDCDIVGAIYKHRPQNSNTNPTLTNTPLTAPEVSIDKLRFYVFGASTNDGQPRVFLVINGTAGLIDATKTTFNLQTTVTQRQFDSANL